MSAIAGILWTDAASAEPGAIHRLTTAMQACGPDGRAHWAHGAVAFGHCMLRATPESVDEHQPLANEDESVVLVWDGRLDNREELQRELTALGARLRTASDAELVLRGYEAWGSQCPAKLLGDFAFAAWDGPRNRMFCARDAMGARPFFFTRSANFFAFASEDEALARLPGVPNELSEAHIAYFLVPSFLGFDSTHSWLKNIRALGAAQSMTVAPGRSERIDTYWRLEPGPMNSYASDEECVQAFLKVFAEAVRCRMRARGEVACMLSGGLDSASTLAMTRRVAPAAPVHTFSAVSDDVAACIESQCILSLACDGDATAHHVRVPSFTGMLDLEDLVQAGWANAHPIDNSLLLPAMMCLAASRSGHRVMMTAVCGDLTTQGTYPYIVALVKQGLWRRAWRECGLAGAHHTYLQGQSRAAIFVKSLYRAATPSWLQRAVRRIRGRSDQTLQNDSLISTALAARVGVAEWQAASARQDSACVGDMQRAHIRSMQPPHGIASSLGGYNRVAGKAGVELRDPWADRRVVEFWVRLPLQYKFRGGWTKYLVRRAFENELPAEVVWRVGKQHVGWNFFYRLMDETPQRTTFTMEQGLQKVDNFVDPQAARRQYETYLATGGAHDAREKIYDLVTLVSWMHRCRQFDD